MYLNKNLYCQVNAPHFDFLPAEFLILLNICLVSSDKGHQFYMNVEEINLKCKVGNDVFNTKCYQVF